MHLRRLNRLSKHLRITKPIHPHAIRHARLTDLDRADGISKGLSEMELLLIAGGRMPVPCRRSTSTSPDVMKVERPVDKAKESEEYWPILDLLKKDLGMY